MNNCGPAGNTPVDVFPILKYFPPWFPGTFYANHAKSCRWVIRKLYDYPYELLTESMTRGNTASSVLASELEKMAMDSESLNDPEGIEDVKSITATAFAAGADTTWATLNVFLLAMLLHPEVVRKAHDELDLIVGQDRFPEFSDRESLPYVECILQETLRWHPVLPMVVPHRLLEDDVYRGMFIPKGSIIFANARGIGLDEKVYANPYNFYPERFLPKPAGSEETQFTAGWGYGRRICPGRFVADASLWLVIATMLSVFDISKRIGPDGKPITPSMEFSDGLVRHPHIGPCDIRPRSDRAISLIEFQT